jgi:outer membrane receptor protein involved in Fe transport
MSGGAYRAYLVCGSALLALAASDLTVIAQEKLPELVVTGTKQKPRHRPAVHRVAARPAPVPPSNPVVTTTQTLDTGRNNIYAPLGTAPTTISHATIEALPQGTNTPIEKLVLQTPGVTQDSAAGGNFHVRNEHGNVQVRINGIMLPDGVSGFGTFLDTALIGNISLITGALPAQYGLRTSGVLDITTRTDAFNNSGSVGVYGGSRGTFTPSFEYGGTLGGNCPGATTALKPTPAVANCYPVTEYFFTGRYFQSNIGLENPTPNWNAIHDHTQQERGFGYVSTIIDPYTRFSLITGASYGSYQIPNNPGQMPNFTAFGVANFDSAALNQNQLEQTYFGVAAWQRSINGADLQLSYFTRYSSVHFTPDPIGDLVFNGVASDVYRSSIANGVTGDLAYQINGAHTLRTGFILRTESTNVTNTNTLLPLDMMGNPVDAPFTAIDASKKTGYGAGAYVQDEWRITNQLILNAGLRFDQYWAYISENQFSPRVSLTWKPFETTTFHAGYARTFTPPEQVLAAPTNLALVANTTQQPSVMQNDPVRAERAHVFDVGVVQQVLPGFEIGLDTYYKKATDLIDDGQFGAAYVLTAFNYAQGENVGVELSAKYKNGPFQAYGNIAWARQIATNPVSNQFLFDNATPLADLGGLTEYQYLQSHWVFTDHAQLWTGSAGLSYQFCGEPASPGEYLVKPPRIDGGSWWGSLCGLRVSADMIYGSGLRDGDANISTVPAYTQFNVGIARDFFLLGDPRPFTLRFDVVNLFDTVYFIRDGSGIGVFAPQYGPRRGYFVGLSKKI